MDKAIFIQDFHKFLQMNNLEIQIPPIDETTNLLEEGWIDSLKMVELIMYLEELIGEEIAIENYQLRKFYTIKSIYDTFVAGKTVQRGVATNA